MAYCIFYFLTTQKKKQGLSTFDLTLSTQKQHQNPSLTDGKFFWNQTLHLPYIRAGISTSEWLLKITFGSVDIKTVYVGAKQVKAALISRLSNKRAGTRFVSEQIKKMKL